MKRKISIILFITLLILCSCGKKENKKANQDNITENQKLEAEKYNRIIIQHYCNIDDNKVKCIENGTRKKQY